MTTGAYEMEPRRVEAFAVIDLDRTLLDTSALVDMLLLQLHDHGFTSQQVQSYTEHVHSQAGSALSLSEFFATEFEHRDGLLALLKQEILEIAETGDLSDDLLYPGSTQLLDALDAKTIPFAILTYGNVTDQDFKLSLLRLLTRREVSQLHATVTSQQSKAQWVAEEWSGDDGLMVPDDIYSTEPVIAEYVVVIDDKTLNLASTNPNVLGILIDNGAETDRSITVELLGAAVAAGESLVDFANHYGSQKPRYE